MFFFIVLAPGVVGCSNAEHGKVLKDLFMTSYFRITVVDDVQTVEMCGALKVKVLLLCVCVCVCVSEKTMFRQLN